MNKILVCCIFLILLSLPFTLAAEERPLRSNERAKMRFLIDQPGQIALRHDYTDRKAFSTEMFLQRSKQSGYSDIQQPIGDRFWQQTGIFFTSYWRSPQWAAINIDGE
ncbi:hypothetical protein HYS48_02400 [Candidatus Woesearchaeota archaeon]|nr:hypothetical protein [Candidatus Woesearchaeota archaeon]